MFKHIIWILIWIMVGAMFSNFIHRYIPILPAM